MTSNWTTINETYKHIDGKYTFLQKKKTYLFENKKNMVLKLIFFLHNFLKTIKTLL